MLPFYAASIRRLLLTSSGPHHGEAHENQLSPVASARRRPGGFALAPRRGRELRDAGQLRQGALRDALGGGERARAQRRQVQAQRADGEVREGARDVKEELGAGGDGRRGGKGLQRDGGDAARHDGAQNGRLEVGQREDDPLHGRGCGHGRQIAVASFSMLGNLLCRRLTEHKAPHERSLSDIIQAYEDFMFCAVAQGYGINRTMCQTVRATKRAETRSYDVVDLLCWPLSA